MFAPHARKHAFRACFFLKQGIGAGVDYDGRWKAQQYYARRYFSPALVAAREDGTRVSLWITNDGPAEFEGILFAGRRRITVPKGEIADLEGQLRVTCLNDVLLQAKG
jgi:hypothetical protein